MRNMKLTEPAKESRRAYYKAWRRKNRDKVHEYNRRYWERKVETEAEGRSYSEEDEKHDE